MSSEVCLIGNTVILALMAVPFIILCSVTMLCAETRYNRMRQARERYQQRVVALREDLARLQRAHDMLMSALRNEPPLPPSHTASTTTLYPDWARMVRPSAPPNNGVTDLDPE